MDSVLKQHRLMIIGASWEQVPLIEKAKRMGHYILVTSTTKSAEGLFLADQSAIVDPRDLPKILKIARSFQPDGITADECDYSHYAAVFISKNLGLPHDGLAAAQYTTNKLWMREQCHKVQILQPRFISCRIFKDAQHAIDLIGWPVIVKPVDNRGAFGINVVNSNSELESAYLDALMNSHSREVIIEAYIEGTHITVDGCVGQDGVHYNLAIASKKVIPGDKPIITQVDYPANISGENCDYVFSVNSQVVEALEIRGGLTHSEYILDKKGRCFLVETANRGGGVLTSAYIVPAMSGVDVSTLLINNALGKDFIVTPEFYTGFVILKFFVFKPGQVKKILGVKEAKQLEGVQHIKLMVSAGNILVQPQSGADRHGFVILKADTVREIDNLYKTIMSTIRVIYEEN
jgi:biotin carboxylase